VPAQVFGFPVKWLPLLAIPLLLENTLLFSLGEELGWRGYLLPHLVSLGPWRAVLLTGLLHGIWHLPLILLTPLYHAGGNHLIVIPLFPVSTTIAGMFFGCLRLATGSVWPASIAHTAHNLFWAVFAAFTMTSSPFVTEYLAGDTGLLVVVGYAVVGGGLMHTLTRLRRLARVRVMEMIKITRSA
jgi:membrane protease YdiL (CAAX protease family)